MRALYNQIPGLPRTILFHHGQSLKYEGFRWAPLSFLSSGSSKSAFFDDNSQDLRMSRRDEKGLHVRFPGYLISEIKRPMSAGSHFHFADPQNPELIWRLVPERSSVDFLASREAFMEDRERRNAFDRVVYESRAVGLIMNPEVSSTTQGVLLRIKGVDNLNGDEENEIWGRLMCRISLYSVAVMGLTKEELEMKEGVRIKARKLTNLQKWCVA